MNFKYMLHFPDDNLYATNRDYVSIDYKLVKDEHDATLVDEDDLRYLFTDAFDLAGCIGAEVLLENGAHGLTGVGFIHIEDLRHIYSNKEDKQ